MNETGNANPNPPVPRTVQIGAGLFTAVIVGLLIWQVLKPSGSSQTLGKLEGDLHSLMFTGDGRVLYGQHAGIQISSDGVITALKNLGSSQIIASVGSVQSDAMLVTIAQPISGAVLIPDAEIVSDLPRALDPITIGEMGSQYVIQVKTAPTVGSMLISSEGK